MKTIVCLLIAIWPLVCDCQKQGNQWHFGTQTGLNFNTAIPLVQTNGQTGTDILPGGNQEGTACISDSSGALLFYTGGKTIWNKNHQVMLNGSGINGGTSSTQAALIVPLPGNDSLFYVFTSDEFQSYTSPPRKGYRYSVVNMCLDNGKGGVISNQKNILLIDSATEKLTACRDLAGSGYWILGHKMYSDQFYAWHLTATGISTTVVSSIGTFHGWYPQNSVWYSASAQGQMKLDPSGTRLALVLGNLQPANLDLFDFDRSTGNVSNFCHIILDSVRMKSPYGLEFSPDGKKLYYAQMGGMSPNVRLYQLDLSASGSCSAIRSSSLVIFQSNMGPGMSGMQLGPDNKIYIVYKGNGNLARINSPNLSGSLCALDTAAFTGPAINVGYAFPSFIAGYAYSNNLVKCNQYSSVGINSNSAEVKLSIYPVPSSAEITVELGRVAEKNASILLFDHCGQLVVHVDDISNTVVRISTAALGAGLYSLVYRSNGKIIGRARVAIEK